MLIFHYYNHFRLHTTHREGCISVNLILGSDAKAGVAVSSSPCQVDGCLQLVVHLLVDRTTKLSAIISENKQMRMCSVNINTTQVTFPPQKG